MANFIVTFPNAVQTRIENSIAEHFSYSDQISDPNNPGQTIPNPETKAQFAERMFKEQFKKWVVDIEAGNAAKAARIAQETTSNSEINIT